jgi:hypothetical protein
MKKIFWEVLGTALLVLLPTAFFYAQLYAQLKGIPSFWNAQFFWNLILAGCWVVVSSGYYHQGWMVRSKGHADNISFFLPCAVFLVQCILFVKGIYYSDWTLIWGALVVNSGVLFSLYQIYRVRNHGI